MLASISEKVERSIYARPRGTIFFRVDFSKIGPSTAVRQALHRLEQKGVIMRLAQGIYVYPKKHKTLGTLIPSVDEVAYAIARRDKARIIPTGVQALNQLGLSTQVPLNPVYLIDGAPRTVKVGNWNIKFKKTSPKIFSIKNEVNLLVVQALREVGEERVEDKMLNKIKLILSNIDEKTIRKDMKLAPVWISSLIFHLLNFN